MRATNDGRGEGSREKPFLDDSGDAEVTRALSRDELVPGYPVSEEPGHTREFVRDGFGEEFLEPTRDPSDPARTTQVFSHEDRLPPVDPGGAHTQEGSEGVEFTRRFVRERLPGRGDLPNEPDPGAPDDVADGSSRWRPGSSGGTSPEEGRPRRGRPPKVRRRRFRVRWIVLFLLVVALAIPPGTWGWVWYTARQDDRDPSDAIVVLGASQYNGVPSPVFEARLRQAQALYLDGVAPVIVTVGGKQPEDAFTEAAAGRNWLIEVGVPPERVVAVEEGSDTLQSIGAVSEVFDERAWESAILVSDPWHSLRAERMAGDHGIEAGTSPARSGPAVIERSTQLWYITRETASLWYYWIFNDSSDIQVNAA